jgi:hypothetical protein
MVKAHDEVVRGSGIRNGCNTVILDFAGRRVSFLSSNKCFGF